MNSELKQFIDRYMSEDTDTKMMTVFPIPCGIGKSEYITYLLADAILNRYGLIVVTDAVDRLNEYITKDYDKEIKSLTTYINANLSKISILNSDNIADEISRTSIKPIIMMTTQRYFDLDREDIIKFTSGQNYKRSKIVFDERIYLLESRNLTVKSLNDIATTLREGLDNEVDSDDKQWIVSQYDTFNAKLQQKLTENELQNNDAKRFRREVYFNPGALIISEDDSKFYGIVKQHSNKLRKYNFNSLKDIKTLNKLLIDGAVTSQKIKSKKSNQAYKNYYTVITNNADKLIDIGAKTFVLDGTADVSPEYQLNCVNMVDCSQFKKDLSKLTINIVNVNTSKDRLTRKGDKTEHLIQAIIDYIKAQPFNIDTVFTYQAIEAKFKDAFTRVEHFNNIKGSNDYRDVNNICQVGLNRWSELIYMIYANEIGQYNNPDKLFNHRIYDKETIDDIRCRLILADFEQNLFRCKIRNSDNMESCTYTLICNVGERNGVYENYQPLINMIKTRYEPSGATVNVIDTPIEFKLLKAEERQTENETSLQKFNRWLKRQPKGRLFKRADVKRECNFSDSQFQDILDSGILKSLKTEKRGIYIVK